MEPPPSEEPHGRCGAKTRSGEPCKNVAGKGTDHVGIGRCRYHGGATPIKHGMYSSVVRETLGELVARERRKKGIKWSELGGLIEDFWQAVEDQVEDDGVLDRVAAEWVRIYDEWKIRGPFDFLETR